jgi:hypothetical protein
MAVDIGSASISLEFELPPVMLTLSVEETEAGIDRAIAGLQARREFAAAEGRRGDDDETLLRQQIASQIRAMILVAPEDQSPLTEQLQERVADWVERGVTQGFVDGVPDLFEANRPAGE